MTTTTLMVLAAVQRLLSDNKEIYGLQIIQQCRLTAGTVYQILNRLEREGLLVCNKETEAEARVNHFGSPPRRYLKLTKKGQAELKKLEPRLKELGLV